MLTIFLSSVLIITLLIILLAGAFIFAHIVHTRQIQIETKVFSKERFKESLDMFLPRLWS